MVIWPFYYRIPTLALDLQGMQTPPYIKESGLTLLLSAPASHGKLEQLHLSIFRDPTPPLSSITTICRHCLLEFRTITRFLDFFSRLQSLVGSTRTVIEVDLGQLSVLSLELRFQIYFDISRCNLNGLRIWEMYQITLACRISSTVWICYPPSSGA